MYDELGITDEENVILNIQTCILIMQERAANEKNIYFIFAIIISCLFVGCNERPCVGVVDCAIPAYPEVKIPIGDKYKLKDYDNIYNDDGSITIFALTQ